MLYPNEFSVGSIGQAAGLTLVIPRTRYEHFALLSQAAGNRTIVFLDGTHAFASFNCENNTNWKGLLVPNVSLEIDETSVFDPEDGDVPLGALIRVEDQLRIVAKPESGFVRRSLNVLLIANLPQSETGMAAGFGRWRAVIGEGYAKRELKAMDVTTPRRAS